MTDLSPYVTAHRPGDGGTRLMFPNGHHANVIPDPHDPLRFEVYSSDPADTGWGHVVAGLTTAEAEAKLATLAALPAKTDET